MKIIKLALVIAIGYFGYNQYQESFAAETPLSGNWKSNKQLSMKELYKIGLTQKQEAFFNKMLGKMTYTISGDKWDSNFNGESTSGSYTVISKTNDCYNLNVSGESKEVCIKDGNLYVNSKFGSNSYNEVFSPL